MKYWMSLVAVLSIFVEVEHTDTLNLKTFTVAARVKFVSDTGGGEQNIAYKQVGDDRAR